MDFLSKFTSIVPDSCSRISEADQHFCSAAESAYQKAKAALQELQYFWQDIQDAQKEALQGTGLSCETYLTKEGHLRLSHETINDQLLALHEIFIDCMVRYFNGIYHVKLSSEFIKEQLLPEKPDHYCRDAEKAEAYQAEMLRLTIRADQIVEQIFAQMDGRGLWEQALFELKEACHTAAWNRWNEKPTYERRKAVLQFSPYSCTYDNWGRYERWELSSGLKQIVRGIAHYETECFSIVPSELSPLLSYEKLSSDSIEFTLCQKIKQLKMFKNGRVDLRFCDEAAAQRFVEDYLSAVY